MSVAATAPTREKVMNDIGNLRPLFAEASRYAKGFKVTMASDYASRMIVNIRRNGLTPTGKKPKYAYTVDIDIPEKTWEPPSWKRWIDDYVRGRASDPRGNMPDQCTVVAHMGYYENGAVGKGDFYFWQSGKGLIVKIRSDKNGLFLSEVAKKRIQDSKRRVLYKRGKK